METVQNARYAKHGDDCNCSSLFLLKIYQISDRDKSENTFIKYVCQLTDQYKYRKCFL